MSTYTMSDFCQGHGATCPDWEYCDADHGERSYCDGTCAEARWAYRDYLRTHSAERPAPSTDHVSLEVSGRDSQYIVRFDGPDAEDHALAYIEARASTHAFHELPEEPFSGVTFQRLATRLSPLCEHGLSLDLCEGPEHYPTRAQEMAWGW